MWQWPQDGASKGKSKGKGQGKEKGKSYGQGCGSWEGTRQRVSEQRAVGVLVDWQHKGGKSFGWIAPIHGITKQSGSEQYHGGDLYVHWKDIQDPRPGAVVTFWPYLDQQGLGAEDCMSRTVSRFVVPKQTPSALTLPTVEVNQVATYLPTSIFYPELEEQGVTLRKYLWDAPLTVYELWGSAQDIVQAADDMGLLAHPACELLVSTDMARNEPPERLRDIDSSHLPHVPPRFRVGLKLGGTPDARERLLALLAA